MAEWIVGPMAEWGVGRILDALTNICSEYNQDQSESQSTMEKMLQGLRQNLTMIEAVLFVACQAQIQDQNPLNNFIGQLRDGFAEAANFLVEFENKNHEEQLTENKRKRKVGFIKSCLSESSSKICQVGKRVLKIDPNLKRLEEVVQKLDKISANLGLYFSVLTYTNLVQLQQEFQLFRTLFGVNYRAQRELESCHSGSRVRLGSRGWSAGETSRCGKQGTSSFSSLHFISTSGRCGVAGAQAMRHGGPQMEPKTLETGSLPSQDVGRVLDNLQPHNNLKELTIIQYMGVRPAIWMNIAYLICNLGQIHLSKCLEWQTLPPFGQLPFLKFLHLLDMPKVKRIAKKFHGNDKGCIFPSLEVLHIEKLGALEDWFDAATTTDDGLFPCLTELYLYDCPNIQELPYLPPNLKKLEINNIGWKTFRLCNISKSIPLEVLKVICCPNIAYISLADVQTTLRYLRVSDCPNLIFL